MYKICQLLLVLCLVITFNSLFTVCGVYAQPKIEKLVLTPNVSKITIGSEVKEIEIFVQLEKPDEPGLQFEWELKGPGKLEGDTESPAIFYIVPKRIKSLSAQAIVRVTVTNDKGKTPKSVTFTLKPMPKSIPASTPTPAPTSVPTVTPSPTPTLTPTPIPPTVTSSPTPTPTPTVTPVPPTVTPTPTATSLPPTVTPTPVSPLTLYLELKQKEQQGANVNNQIISVIRIIAEALKGTTKSDTSHLEKVEQLLTAADALFKDERFMSLKGDNAFDLYKEVLELNPANRYARDKIYAIGSICRTEIDRANQEGDESRANMYNEYYQITANYLLDFLSAQFTQADLKRNEAEEKEDRKEELIQTLRIVEILREFKRIYEPPSREGNVEMEQALKKTEELIDEYEQDILRE